MTPSESSGGEPLPALMYKAKRKASQFSLRSLTQTLSKRPRLGIRKWANSVLTRHFGLAKQKWRYQTEQEKRDYAAWKANRRRSRPADALIGKSEKGFGAFSFDRCRYGDEEWWKEGVSKYQAPKWMFGN